MGNKTGRKLLDIKENDVEKLASYGLKNIEIAEYFGCDESTIGTRFSIFLTKGRSRLKKSLRKKQIDVALGGNVVMLIWLGKQYLGQADKSEHDVKMNSILDFVKHATGTK